ncbi:hypothetical protein [Emticicia sp. 17c]|uniref:hypothetical protein n=1 Tax=Emticicia sp. 17c TaxID=3127704 RepID=UPI00301D7EDF
MNPCFKKNPLIHSGQTQEQRQKTTLSPSYVQVDERSTEDLLVFLKQYAPLVKYYNELDVVEGDFSKILASDTVYLLAEISLTNLNAISKTFSELIQGYEKSSKADKRKEFYAALYDLLYSVLDDINHLYKAMPERDSFKNEIYFEIDKYLATEFNLLVEAFRFGTNAPNNIFVANSNLGIENNDYSYKFRFAAPVLSSDALINATFSEVMLGKMADGFNQKFFGIPLLTNKFDQLDYSVVSIKQLFRRIFDTYNRIIEKTKASFKKQLTENSAHQGHHGLILTFLELFRIYQNEINQFTGKHFDFYLKEALQLNQIAGSPDQVHVLFEPTANVNGYKIAAKTPLKAGKDDIGKDLVYTTNEDLILNQAKVDEIKTVFVEANKKIYALPVANSADGLGKDLTPAEPSWAGFGLDEKLDKNKKNTAAIGFAVASPVLLLQEGTRTLTLNFTATGMPASCNNLAEFKKYFQVYLSTSKGWAEAPLADAADTFSSSSSSFILKFKIIPEFPSIIPYDSKTMEGGFATQYPVIRFMLKQDIDGTYDKFRNLSLTQIDIYASVEDVKNLSLQNDLGNMDNTKPFMPFGAVPKKGSTFYVGNQEVFRKNLKKLVFKLQWLGLPTNLVAHYEYQNNSASANVNYLELKDLSDFQVEVSFLDKKNWKNAGKALLFPTDSNITIVDGKIDSADTPGANQVSFQFGEYASWDVVWLNGKLVWKTPHNTQTAQPLSADTEKGFAKFELINPDKGFGHEVYPIIMAQQAVKLASDSAKYSLPNPPHTPTLKALTLDYDAYEEIKLGKDEQLLKGQFYVIHPFGFDEQQQAGAKMLVQYEHQSKAETNEPFESALYLGITDIDVLQTLTLFFQVAEGTENIEKDPADLRWSYLSNTGWKNLNTYLIGDSTQSLLQSGIVKINLPADASRTSPLFASKKYWLRASVKDNSLAQPRLLLVKTQAVRATFQNQQNSPNHLTRPLAGGVISKLINSDSSIKSVSQPFASFGGRMIEDNTVFHTRISERLRHKNRAITIWDYEHLILQRFPLIHKVKCLNHTGYKEKIDPITLQPVKKYSESLAGSVMLVVIPDIRTRTGGNAFMPKVSKNTLATIKQYIQGMATKPCQPVKTAMNCGFADLLVENPCYERIKVSGKVKFMDCLDTKFYINQLLKDLNEYLAPWTSEKNRTMNFGGTLHKSVILNFIENLNYVDYITDFGIALLSENGDLLNAANPDEAITKSSRSILTTAENHNIDVVN